MRKSDRFLNSATGRWQLLETTGRMAVVADWMSDFLVLHILAAVKGMIIAKQVVHGIAKDVVFAEKLYQRSKQKLVKSLILAKKPYQWRKQITRKGDNLS